MSKIKLFSKIIPIALISSIFLAACDVPDISKFTEQSAEMTRGIRQGVEETDAILADAAERDDLFDAEQSERIAKQLTEYRKNTKTTVRVLESTDAYLEALNALAAANKKSGDNSKAVVDAVGALVDAVGGITIADGAVKLATGIVTLLEKFRTAKAFKKRVEIADRIMNGGDATGKPCGQDPRGALTKKFRDQIDLIDSRVKAERETSERKLKEKTDEINAGISALKNRREEAKSDAKKQEIDAEINGRTTEIEKARRSAENEISELYARRAAGLDDAQKKRIETAVDGLQCGVIDLLKFNVEDLRAIHASVSKTLYIQTKIKNRTVLDYHDAVVAEDERVQKTLLQILDYKARTVRYNDFARFGDDAKDLKESIKDTLNGIFITDSKLQSRICAIIKCIGFTVDAADFASNFDGYGGSVFAELGARVVDLLDLNKRYTADLQRIEPEYNAAVAELKRIKDKQKQIDALFQTGGEALDGWAATHANLRLALETKKPLTVARLASKVKEIRSILKPQASR